MLLALLPALPPALLWLPGFPWLPVFLWLAVFLWLPVFSWLLASPWPPVLLEAVVGTLALGV